MSPSNDKDSVTIRYIDVLMACGLIALCVAAPVALLIIAAISYFSVGVCP